MAVKLSEHFTVKKLLTAVYPTVLMMVFTSIYGIVDGIFISNSVGTTAFAGVNLIMPILMITGSIGFMLGAGGSALVANTLGEGDKERANKIFTMIVLFTVILSIIFTVGTYFLIEPIAIWLGGEKASPEMIRVAVKYGKILTLFQGAFMLQNVFQSLFVVAEKAMFGFIVIAIAGCANMALDALFIVVFGWGVTGAAVATGISQVIGGFIPVIYFLSKNSSTIQFAKTKLEFKVLLKSAINGSSELLSNIAMSVVSILFNMQLLKEAGDNGVAAYGIIMYAGFIFCAIFIGYCVGVAPIVGYHNGAKNHAELTNLLKKSLLIILVLSGIMLISIELLAGVLSSIFTNGNTQLLQLTTRGFRLYGLSFALCGFSIFASGFFTALNNGLVSAIISFVRTLIFQVLFIMVLPIFMGLTGIWLSVVFAEICSLAVCLICFIKNKEKYQYWSSPKTNEGYLDKNKE